MKVEMAYILDKTRYFALLSHKIMVMFRQETGTEHVAIATLKCVPSGMFRRVLHPCQVSIVLLHYWQRLILCHTTVLAQRVTSSVATLNNRKKWIKNRPLSTY